MDADRHRDRSRGGEAGSVVPRHHEFGGFVMAWGLGSVKVTKRKISYLDASWPPGCSRWTAQHHGAGDAFRGALGRLASFALVGRKIRCRPTPTEHRHVMSIGSSIRQASTTPTGHRHRAEGLAGAQGLGGSRRNFGKCRVGGAVIGIDDGSHAIVGRGHADVGFKAPQDVPIG